MASASDAEDPIDAMIGHRVHDVMLVRVLALGTYGAVYLAERNGTRERFAVKCLFKTGLKPEHMALQHAEIAMHEHLRSHPNLVALVDTLETADHLFLVFEYAARGDLYDFIKREADGIYDKSLAQRLLLQIAAGLQFCHGRGVYHRDIKPENVLLTDDWVAKLGDFGLATHATAPTEYGCGSPPYMAPEVIDRTTPTYDAAAADVWSLGIVFFNMLFGVNPWEKAVDTDRRYRRYVAAPTTYLASRFQMTPAVHTLFQQVLHPDPARRLTLPAFRDAVAALDVAELYPLSMHYGVSPAVSMQTHPLRMRPLVHGANHHGGHTATNGRLGVAVTVAAGFGGAHGGGGSAGSNGTRATADHGWHQDHAAASIPKSRASSGTSNAASIVVGSWADDLDLPMDFTAPVVFEDGAGTKATLAIAAASAPAPRGLAAMLSSLGGSTSTGSSSDGDSGEGGGDRHRAAGDDDGDDAASHSSDESHDIFALDLHDEEDVHHEVHPVAPATATATATATAARSAAEAARLPPLVPRTSAAAARDADARVDQTRNALRGMRLSPPRKADDVATPVRQPSVLVVTSR